MELKVPDEQNLKCPVCAETFISDKSLYGHMRNHPERKWRGMKPPIHETENDYSSLPVSGSVALERSHYQSNVDTRTHLGTDLLLPRWSKTGGRTRPGKAPVFVPAKNESYDFQVIENCEPVKENLPPKKRKLDSAVLSNSRCPLLNKKLIIQGGGLKTNDKIANPGPPESSKRGNDLLVFNDGGIIHNKSPVRTRKHYVCDICARSFKSYQALCGHKAHHNNNKARHKITSTGEEKEVLGHHQCPFCNKMFLKGQALGGHKRHCRGQVTKYESRVFSFDLNELPPE